LGYYISESNFLGTSYKNQPVSKTGQGEETLSAVDESLVRSTGWANGPMVHGDVSIPGGYEQTWDPHLNWTMECGPLKKHGKLSSIVELWVCHVVFFNHDIIKYFLGN